MNPTSRLGRQVTAILAALQNVGVQSALIGGLALAPHKVVRATQDIDLLIDQDAAEIVDRELVRLGYRCLHRSADVGNYQNQDERVDFLYASRPAARRLLAQAVELKTPLGSIRVVSGEGLKNHPFVGEGGVPYTADATRDPFAALDDLMTVVEALCPVWPTREPTKEGSYWLL
jgi:hypothetical protein